jgi:aminobenzoyl-glutamate transport protein
MAVDPQPHTDETANRQREIVNDRHTVKTASAGGWIGRVERIGRLIPDPVVIFMFMFVFCLLLTGLLGGIEFRTFGSEGTEVVYEIRNMLAAEEIRWLFDNAILRNWLAFGEGVLGIILVVMLGVGIAEHSGLLSALIKRIALKIPERWLPLLLVFLGIMSSVAADAGYLILIPLAGLLYAGLGKNPLIGMAAAFAGVSAGFSANLFPGTSDDVFLGANARAFAESQGVPFTDASGRALTPATMNFFFMFLSALMLSGIGAWITRRYVAPHLERRSFVVPDDIRLETFAVTPAERKGLKAALVGILVALIVVGSLSLGPLAAYTNDEGERVVPFLDNIILLIAMVFAIVGIFFGVAGGRFHSTGDVVKAMVREMDTMGYILVLTFFCYNFLGLLSYSGLGAYITYSGAVLLTSLGLHQFPVLLIVGFVLVTASINIFVAGLNSKWMLLGPIFIPMLYQVNSDMTPDVVTVAYRIGDSSTNIITPMLVYAGVILAFMRKYKPELGFGDVIAIMLPYSIAFLIASTLLVVAFFSLGLPFGF